MGSFAEQVLVTCEHATNRVPHGFDLPNELRDLHIAWDPGARPIAAAIARHFDAPLRLGEYSRLVVDLNRSADNRMVIRRVSDGHRIAANYELTRAQRQRRIEEFYRPYRDAVDAAVAGIIRRHGRCVHVSVHTFTPALAGNERGNDIGLLHDPRWGIERGLCHDVRAALANEGDWVVWFNRPYSGTADGILPAMRRQHSPDTFVGLELEINQKYAADRRALGRIGRALARAIDGSATLRGEASA